MPHLSEHSSIERPSLTILVKLTDFGTAAPLPLSSKEDERASALARRAQLGDYSEGTTHRLP